ncbi:hypothetical protein PMIN01_08682 [Paraphaeosphaeria minitans]|uniref:Uncharacterized protein n=1 Tax=Paraphaeosphaeria minitans TaxID=565426 RepID=A0A9P6KNI4_9PLEO|nr:hypothetical protein PMIN01_08682 [Paraphaeosphaeria minitans]
MPLTRSPTTTPHATPKSTANSRNLQPQQDSQPQPPYLGTALPDSTTLPYPTQVCRCSKQALLALAASPPPQSTQPVSQIASVQCATHGSHGSGPASIRQSGPPVPPGWQSNRGGVRGPEKTWLASPSRLMDTSSTHSGTCKPGYPNRGEQWQRGSAAMAVDKAEHGKT